MKFKKNILLFSIIFLVVILVFSTSYTVHYASDSWKIMNIGLEKYSHIALGNGRLIQYLILNVFSIFNFEFISLYRIFLTITAIFISLSIFITYKFFREEGKNSKVLNMILLVSSFNVFLTMALSEMCIFIECLTMSLSIMLSILSSILFYKKRYIICFILLLSAALSYQASITLFPVYILIKHFSDEKNKKIDLKYILKVLLVYYLSLGACFLFLKIIQSMGLNIDNRMQNFNIYSIFYMIYNIFCFFVILMYMFIIYFCKTPKQKAINFFVIILVIILTTCSLTFGSTSILSFRMMLSLFGIFGIFGIYNYCNSSLKDNNKFLLIFEIILLIVNIFLFLSYMSINIRQTIQTQKVFESCKQITKEYEEKTNNKIENICFYYDNNLDCATLDIAAVWTPYTVNWARKDFFELIIKRELKEVEMDERIYDKYFKGKNWEFFSKEQIVMKDNNLYFCIY